MISGYCNRKFAPESEVASRLLKGPLSNSSNWDVHVKSKVNLKYLMVGSELSCVRCTVTVLISKMAGGDATKTVEQHTRVRGKQGVAGWCGTNV